jgi:hypothetical protein
MRRGLIGFCRAVAEISQRSHRDLSEVSEASGLRGFLGTTLTLTSDVDVDGDGDGDGDVVRVPRSAGHARR